MSDLFNSNSEALYGDKLPPIENASINILSPNRALFYYTVGDKEIELELDIDVDHCKGEAQSHDSPGEPASAEITKVYGLIAGRQTDAWHSCMAANEKVIELELLGAIQYEQQQQVG